MVKKKLKIIGETIKKDKVSKKEEKALKARLTPVATQRAISQQKVIISKEQAILKSMFGGNVGKRVLGDTRPKITNTLTSGFGLIKNEDYGYTSSLFLPTKSGRKII